jgi:hypothetical protein
MNAIMGNLLPNSVIRPYPIALLEIGYWANFMVSIDGGARFLFLVLVDYVIRPTRGDIRISAATTPQTRQQIGDERSAESSEPLLGF